jgi:putative SOS response-associated peptidase YedK
VDGFYEWREVAGKKYPYLITREDKAPMVFAGLYDSSDGCAIITAPAQGVVAALHNRMPVTLDADTFAAWLDTTVKDVDRILAAANANGLVCHPVSDRVNSIRNDDATLIERVPDPVAELPKGKTLPLF